MDLPKANTTPACTDLSCPERTGGKCNAADDLLPACFRCQKVITGFRYNLNDGITCDNCWEIAYHRQQSEMKNKEMKEKFSHLSYVADRLFSNCCFAIAEVSTGDEGTSHYQCSKCSKPCDAFQVGDTGELQPPHLPNVSSCCHAPVYYDATIKENIPMCHACNKPCDVTPHSTTTQAVAYTSSCSNPFHEDLLRRMTQPHLPSWVKVLALTILVAGMMYLLQWNTETTCENALLRIINPG